MPGTEAVVPVNARDQQTGGRFPPELCRSRREFLWESSVWRGPQADGVAVDVEPASASQQGEPRFLPGLCRSRLRFLSASFRSRFCPFDRRPAIGVIYNERTFGQLFGDQRALSVRIIVNDRNVRERKIIKQQIGEASPITPDDHIIGDVMSTLPHAPRHSVKRRLR